MGLVRKLGSFYIIGGGNYVMELMNGGVSMDVANQVSKHTGLQYHANYNYLLMIPELSSASFPKGILPAASVRETMPMIRHMNINLPVVGEFAIPVGTSLPLIDTVLYDDDTCSTEKALRKWVDIHIPLVTKDKGYISTLGDISKEIHVYKLTTSKGWTLKNIYMGYPRGESIIQLAYGASTLKELQVSFAITEVKQYIEER